MRLTGAEIKDEELLQQIKQGSKQAFNILYERHWETTYANAYKRLKDHPQSQDIVQDIFVHIWLKQEELSIRNISAYLAVSVKNRVFKAVAKQDLISPFLDILQQLPATYSETDANIRWKEFYRSYEAILKALPSKRQVIFRLRFQEDLPTKVIANKLGLSVKTVQNQLGKAIEQLRVSLIHLMAIMVVFFSDN
ncbi:sigma-70 family RNA polymerase sigma factor [Daejeonella sp.]|uniref:RNA polymerase sigma factor n=1 Tax=Daejeonella sp. TaxID=2805397 RepID=UPI0030C25F11